MDCNNNKNNKVKVHVMGEVSKFYEFSFNINLVLPTNLEYYLSVYSCTVDYNSNNSFITNNSSSSNSGININSNQERVNDALTFDELMEAISWYEKYSDVSFIRFCSAVIFYLYHKEKYCHYVDYQSYIGFWLNIFFDSSKKVSSLFTANYHIGPKCTSVKYIDYNFDIIVNYIVKDKRFNQWFEYNYKYDLYHLERMIDILNCKTNLYSLSNKNKSLIELLSIKDIKNELDLNINSNNIPTNIISPLYKQELINNNNNSSSSNNSSSNNSSNNNNLKFPNVILKQIIEIYLINYIYSIRKVKELPWTHAEAYSTNQSGITKFAMVSKYFFKVCSDIINSGIEYYWYAPFKFYSSYSLVKVPPIYFNYCSIKGIPYSTNKSIIEYYYSRIEKCIIMEDNINYGVQRRSCIEDTFVLKDNNYLVYPPSMPMLKKLKISYFGGRSNYMNLIKHIIKSSSSTSISSASMTPAVSNTLNQNQNHNGIEYLVIQNSTGFSFDTVYSIMHSLYKYCSSSLKKVRIELPSDDDINQFTNIIDEFNFGHIQFIVFIGRIHNSNSFIHKQLYGIKDNKNIYILQHIYIGSDNIIFIQIENQ